MKPENKAYWPTEELFDCLSDTVFFVKNNLGRYVVVNETLTIRCGLKSKRELIGKTPSEMLGTSLGADYEAQDRNVLASGVPVLNQLELHMYPNRLVGWCITNKYALYNDDRHIIGVAGISQDLKVPDKAHDNYGKLKSVIDFVENNLHMPPNIERLMAEAGLSQYQLDRRVRRVFGLSTGQWVLKMRLDFARQQLSKTEIPIVQVANNIGYEDQSAFTRQFRKATGYTPLAFRKLCK